MVNVTHKATFNVKNYPGSVHAQQITWSCSCGKTGAITDGRSGATMKRARSAHARHGAQADALTGQQR